MGPFFLPCRCIGILLTMPVLLLSSPCVHCKPGKEKFQQKGDAVTGLGSSFGISVRFSGNGKRLVVGEDRYDNKGRVKAYEWNDDESTWDQIGQTIVDSTKYSYFGQSVDIDNAGSRIVVSSHPHNDDTPHELKGLVQVYDFDDIDLQWVKSGQSITGKEKFDYLGTTVAISGDGTRIAASAKKTALNQHGRIRVFDLVQNGKGGAQWEQIVPDIQIDDAEAGDRFGTNMAMSRDGTHIVAGDGYSYMSEKNKIGYALTFRINATAWERIGHPLIGEALGDHLGEGLGISDDGSRIAIGAPNHDLSTGEEDAGYVLIYEWDSVREEYVSMGTINGEKAEDHLGQDLALSGDGNRVLCGGNGFVRVFHFYPTDQVWNEVGEDFGLSRFAPRVAMSGDGWRAAIGNPFGDGSKVTVFASVFVTSVPSALPSAIPSSGPSGSRSLEPTIFLEVYNLDSPSDVPSEKLSQSQAPIAGPSGTPSLSPTIFLEVYNLDSPSDVPSDKPSRSQAPSAELSATPSFSPTIFLEVHNLDSAPSDEPSQAPSDAPTNYAPSLTPPGLQTLSPSSNPATPLPPPSENMGRHASSSHHTLGSSFFVYFAAVCIHFIFV